MGSNPTADIFSVVDLNLAIATSALGKGGFGCHDSLAERSKAVAQGAIPKWRGIEPHSCHFSCMCNYALRQRCGKLCLIEECLAL